MELRSDGVMNIQEANAERSTSNAQRRMQNMALTLTLAPARNR
jgi:hypothetical protein